MKQYPSIPSINKSPKNYCIAFYKYDGSNLRWEYNKKQGWYKFGTRHRLFDHTDEIFSEAIPIFKNISEEIEKATKKIVKNIEHMIVFTEFYGDNSFAGLHNKEDKKYLKLFDVCINKKGLLAPYDFEKYYGNLDFSAKAIYEGNLNKTFIDNVRNNKYNLNEGVVCKGVLNKRIWMTKIKTLEYKEKLLRVYKDNWLNYWE
jgi:hypothetical protein